MKMRVSGGGCDCRCDRGGRMRAAEPGELIAVVGLSCRMPKAANPEALWRFLRDAVDAIVEVPPDRWDANALFDPDPATPGKAATRWGGFVDRPDQFDP